jgi:hypothetical protein
MNTSPCRWKWSTLYLLLEGFQKDEACNMLFDTTINIVVDSLDSLQQHSSLTAVCCSTGSGGLSFCVRATAASDVHNEHGWNRDADYICQQRQGLPPAARWPDPRGTLAGCRSLGPGAQPASWYSSWLAQQHKFKHYQSPKRTQITCTAVG